MYLRFGNIIQQYNIKCLRTFLKFRNSLHNNLSFCTWFQYNLAIGQHSDTNLFTKPKKWIHRSFAVHLKIVLQAIVKFIVFQVVEECVVVLHLFLYELMEDFCGVVLSDVVEDVALD